MKSTRKYFPALAAATLAAGLAVATAPALRAQAQSDANASSTPQTTVDTQQRLQDLEKEMLLLQQEIVSLKDSEAASVKTAAYVQPTAADPGTAAIAQTPAAAPADTKVSLAGLLGPTTISGFMDAYYGYNYNHPITGDIFAPTFAGNGLQAFTNNTNSFALNMVELVVDKAPDATSAESRAGYHISAGYGQAAAVVNNSDITGDGSNFYLKEAYVSYLAPVGKGLTIQVGKFVTPVGAEVIESSSNWNYTRSILFYYAIPYFHFGANAKYTFNPKWSFTGYLVNGWNNSAITHTVTPLGYGQSSGLTYGGSLAYTPNAKWSVTENYFAGPVLDFSEGDPVTVTDWKQISDTVISYTPNSKWAFMLNGDYGFGPKSYCSEDECDSSGVSGVHSAALPPGVFQEGQTATWWGVAGYAKYTINPKSYFAARYEYYNDPQGYTLFGDFSNFDRTHVQEATATYSYNLTSGLQIRGEYRYDYASEPIFLQSSFDEAGVKQQNTATIGFLYTFSSANAK